ncbi:MAG: hypothetical protein R3A79_31310 [Nannocystaceae bacterium]
MSTRKTPSVTVRVALAGLTLAFAFACACAAADDVPLATPASELPPLLLPPGLISDGTTPAAPAEEQRPANLMGTTIDGLDAPRGDAAVTASPQPTAPPTAPIEPADGPSPALADPSAE